MKTDSSNNTCWKGRQAIRIENGTVELVTLLGGGHIAVFRYLDYARGQNVLWEAPWVTREPNESWSSGDELLYGNSTEGRFLSGYSGHALCLDYFGPPTQSDADAGLSLHGEAAITAWQSDRAEDGWNFTAILPRSKLTVRRGVRIRPGESVVSIQETVSNPRPFPHLCDWVQHVTFGPPFFREGESFVTASGKQLTLYLPNENSMPLLQGNDKLFWPFAYLGNDIIDLRQPFSVKSREILAGVQLDEERDVQFLIACNLKLGLGVAYCFRRDDFPWLTVWEENCGRGEPPWNGRTIARGMEFGTNPFPVGKQARIPSQLDSLIGCAIPALGARTARYQMCLFTFTPGTTRVPDNVSVGNGELIFYAETGEIAFRLPSVDSPSFLLSGS